MPPTSSPILFKKEETHSITQNTFVDQGVPQNTIDLGIAPPPVQDTTTEWTLPEIKSTLSIVKRYARAFSADDAQYQMANLLRLIIGRSSELTLPLLKKTVCTPQVNKIQVSNQLLTTEKDIKIMWEDVVKLKQIAECPFNLK